MKTKTILRAFGAVLLCGAGCVVHAIDFKPDAVSLQAGGGTGNVMAGAGVIWDWDFTRLRRKAVLSAQTEVMINGFRADGLTGGDQTYTQLVVLPSLRIHLSRGQSPWFIELGIGASYLDRLYSTPQKQFSTRWNFYDMLGIGHRIGGEDGRHEIGARWVHISNAGVHKPNPGLDLVQVRYVHRF